MHCVPAARHRGWQRSQAGAGGACAIGALESWPEADQLFRHDPSWIGGDAAYSVDLGGGRVLWLFGDSFIAKSPARSRADASFIRNSVAIQSGSADPSAAQIAFAWHDDGGGPSAFFPGRDGHWFWPLGGVRVGSTLVLFLLEEKAVSTGLGFESVGTRVFFVGNPDAPPLEWTLTEGTLPSFGFSVAFGAAVVREGPDVFVFGDQEPGDHSVYIARYDVTALEAGDASSPLFFSGRELGCGLWLGARRDLSKRDVDRQSTHGILRAEALRGIMAGGAQHRVRFDRHRAAHGVFAHRTLVGAARRFHPSRIWSGGRHGLRRQGAPGALRRVARRDVRDQRFALTAHDRREPLLPPIRSCALRRCDWRALAFAEPRFSGPVSR